jgi:ribosomal protein S6E (S10)
MDFYLEQLTKGITSATESLDQDTWSWHPEGKWSAGEIFEHLFLTYTGTIKGFARCLEAGKPLARTPTLADRIRTLVVVGIGYMPGGRKAPKHAAPRGTPREQVIAQVFAKIFEMDAIISQAEAKYGFGTRVLDHPILGPLRGWEWRKFHWVHGRHHLRQICELRRRAAQFAPQGADDSH